MSPRTERTGVRRGFTLLEAMAALTVIGLTSAAALAAAASETRAAARIDHAITAEALAMQRMGTLRLLPRAQMERLPDSIARGQFSPPFGGYRWRATSALVPGEQDIFDLRLVLEWDDGTYAFATRHFSPRAQLRGR